MNQTELIDFVRGQVDADDTDAPSARLTEYARNAYMDITRRRTQWPHLYVEYQLPVVATVNDYELTGLQTLAGTPASDLEFVSTVVSVQNGQVPIVNRDQALGFYGLNPQPGAIECISLGPEKITVYPAPVSDETLRIIGYRRFAEWPGEQPTQEPDLPREFDMCIAWAMCRDFWTSQEEPESAATYARDYEQMVYGRVQRLGRHMGSVAGPTYFTGPRSRGRFSYKDLVKRSLGS